jgi:cytochrome c biogenesis protein CcmG/thiol:disulfide interchange protein DsbE
MRAAPYVAAALLVTACALAPRAAPAARGRVGQILALSAPDLAGKGVDVAADQGKVRVVDFWATWCEPCRDEMPFLAGLLRQRGPQGLAIYAVSFDEDRNAIPGFESEVGVPFTVLWDMGGETRAARFDVSRLPTTFIVDRKGVIRYVHEGFESETARQERQEIEGLLAEPAR